MPLPHLIAHRGYAAKYPENTLLSLQEAIDVGAYFVEFDVQLCADGTPVLFHDNALMRTTGHSAALCDLDYDSIKAIEAAECERFGPKFLSQGVVIPKLSDLVEMLKKSPQVTAFVELKEESFPRQGRKQVLEQVLACTRKISSQCVFLSYDVEILMMAREMGVTRIAWVLKTWSEASEQTARTLLPDFLFCNHLKIPSPETVLWSGSWQWCFYEVIEPELALALHNRGADFIETMDIGKMILDPRLKPASLL